MIEIVYDTEKERIFEFSYKLREYIPDSIYKEHPRYTELHFIQGLFELEPCIQFIGEFPMIWSIHYKYKYKDKGYILVLDEDYGFVSYAVDNPSDRKEVAEYIYSLIAKV
ncbi:hypothetical protein [Bacillus sp. FJAT-28004]|uniref:hypothetical protein n=1 Tax=Bacillus sp. FJAT-28004 TaxID=1679165 RepID=UPI0006B64D89|nr:hypothetical protein [Bacillus sp. FJAT-28004]